jgi:hypothetical protein
MKFWIFDRTDPRSTALPSAQNAAVLYHKSVEIKLPTTKIFLSGDPLGLHVDENFSFALRGLVRHLAHSGLVSPAKQQLILALDRLCHPEAPKK